MDGYDTWDRTDQDDADELQDFSAYEINRDVILFCIDCSPSMLELYDDPVYEGVQTCHLYKALDAAMQIEKKKIITGPNDSVGILLFNTTRKPEIPPPQGSEIKSGTYLYQALSPLSAPKVMELVQLLEGSQEDPGELRKLFPPMETRMSLGDVLVSCNWVFRDGAPKTASKRVFLITDEDNPHPNKKGVNPMATSARTTLIDLVQAGVTVEPFFISTEEKPFDVSKFFSSVLLPNNVDEEEDLEEGASVLPESISISRIEDLLSQMRFREVPKRALFSIPFQLADGFTIGIKGFGLVTEQRLSGTKQFYDLGDRMEVAVPITEGIDEDQENTVEKPYIVYGAELGGASSGDKEKSPSEGEPPTFGARVVKAGNRPFYTAEEIREFRTLGLEPGIVLLGFKPKDELRFEDNVRHSQFIYPDEMAYAGSKRTFSALLQSSVKKGKIAIVRCVTRRNSSPTFCALLPQEETTDQSGWTDPAGFHLIPLPFADDIRQAHEGPAKRASGELFETACAWVDKLVVKNGSYPPDSYPNPTLAFHHEQLQALAFREEYDPHSFEDLTLPPVKQIHKRAGALLRKWKEALSRDDSVNIVAPAKGTKRKAEGAVSLDEDEVRKMHAKGTLGKLRVADLKDFLSSKGQPTGGLKAALVDRLQTWLDQN